MNTHNSAIQDQNVIGLLATKISKQPETTAIVYKSKFLTFKELEEKSNQLANFLIHKGIKKGEFVPICIHRSIEMVIGILGIIKSGGAYIPISPTTPLERLDLILKNTQPQFILTGKNTNYSAAKINTNTENIILDFENDWLKNQSTIAPNINLQATDPIYMIYTSGSTGTPKGVVLPHRAAVNLLKWQKRISISRNGVNTLQFINYTFDVSFEEIFSTLCSGGTLFIVDAELTKDPLALIQFIIKNNINRLFLPYVGLQTLAHTAVTHRSFPKCLREVYTGGDQVKITDQIKIFFLHLRHASLFNQYGPTEASVIVTQLHLHPEEISNWPSLPSIGFPIDNTSIYILDKNNEILSDGLRGEIAISGPCLALGYHKQDEITSEKFKTILDPRKGKIRVYKTGDIGRIEKNGELTFLGRSDNQVKIRGHRIELGEIEYSLGKIKGIYQSAVVAKNSKNGQKQLVAYYSTNISSLHPQEIRTYLANTLPDYMVPSYFVPLEDFPKTSSGKIDHKSLPEPSIMFMQEKQLENPPVTKNQKLISKIWSTCLDVPFININEDFFEIGGNSILAVNVMTLVEQQTGKRLPLTSLFEHSTLERFAALFDDAEKIQSEAAQWSSLVPIKSTGHKSPIYLVHGVAANVTTYYNLLKYCDEDQPIYGLQARGLNGMDAPLTRIEAISKHYIEEILKHNPDGPYNIGGYSFGGYVAFEMAKQLKKMGKKVNQLILFDTPVFETNNLANNSWNKVLTLIQKRYLEVQLLYKAPKTFIKTKKNAAVRKQKKLLKKLGFIKEGANEKLDRAGNIRKLTEINHKAVDYYKLTPIDIAITLFKSKINTFPVKDLKTYGWEPFAPKVNTIEISGDHTTMFKVPNAKEVATRLQKILDQNQAY